MATLDEPIPQGIGSGSGPRRQIDLKDKGKAKLVEPEPKKKIGRKTQIQLDEELALRLYVEEQAELERMQRERIAQEEASREAIN
ncbi:hypothetical protein Tco_0021116 [Tanacetum coccineum]